MLYQEMNIFVKLDLSIHALPGDEYLYFYFNLSVYDLPGDCKYFYFCRDEYFYFCSLSIHALQEINTFTFFNLSVHTLSRDLYFFK